MKEQHRLIVAAQSGYTPRTENYQGREHLVVPVVGLVEGVVHALNAKHGPEFVPASVFTSNAASWEGMPLFEGHPLQNGKPVRGNTPALRAAKSFGIVRNPSIKDEQLQLEAWLDVMAAEEKAPVMLARARAGEPIEISVGVLVDSEQKAGEYNGRAYNAEWMDMDPDHLAMLPAGVLGACSREMGCGVRALAENAESLDEVYTMWTEPIVLREISQETRDKMDKSDFAGPNESFPIEQPGDVHDAAQSIGRAKGDRAAIKRKIIAIAYKKGDAFVAQLPDDWKKKKDMTGASMFSRIMEAVREGFSQRDAQDAADMGRNDLMRTLYEALREVEPNIVNVEDYYPVTDPAHVVYSAYDGNSWVMYERAFDLATSGVVTLGSHRVEVQQITKYEPVEGATPEALEANKGAGSPSSDGNQKPEDSTMKSEKVTKFLETATDCQIKALEAFVEGGAKPVEPAAQPTEEQLRVAQDAREKEIRDAVSAAITADRKQQADLRAATDKREASVKALEAFGYKPEELKDKDQAFLDTTLTACEKVSKPAEQRNATDFGGQGAARTSQSKDEVADAPDLGAKLRAAQEARAKK